MFIYRFRECKKVRVYPTMKWHGRGIHECKHRIRVHAGGGESIRLSSLYTIYVFLKATCKFYKILNNIKNSFVLFVIHVSITFQENIDKKQITRQISNGCCSLLCVICTMHEKVFSSFANITTTACWIIYKMSSKEVIIQIAHPQSQSGVPYFFRAVITIVVQRNNGVRLVQKMFKASN